MLRRKLEIVINVSPQIFNSRQTRMTFSLISLHMLAKKPRNIRTDNVSSFSTHLLDSSIQNTQQLRLRAL